ncbi:MAG: hypothetical protein HY360_12270 [Verrucomicrobia bacterium]|nr:hypothetical protein [Verrucomicrobiota bacterium]
MTLHECPGPNRKAPPAPEVVECPACGAEMEMWTNENKAKCPSCSKEITREQLNRKKGT